MLLEYFNLTTYKIFRNKNRERLEEDEVQNEQRYRETVFTRVSLLLIQLILLLINNNYQKVLIFFTN